MFVRRTHLVRLAGIARSDCPPDDVCCPTVIRRIISVLACDATVVGSAGDGRSQDGCWHVWVLATRRLSAAAQAPRAAISVY